MKTISFPIIRSAGLLSAAVIIGAGASAYAADKASSDAFPTYDSYIKISGQAADITGNKAAFENRDKQPSNGGVGIEDLHLSKDLNKTTTVTVDGKAMTGSEDYLAKFNVTKNEVGSVEVGYKRFRTFYDGVGGFFPLNNQWKPLTNQELNLDRAKFWFEANLTMPNAPVITLRYTNELRDGRKDSTIWGDTDLTGLPFAVAPNPISAVRKLIPSYIQVGERHQAIELSARQTVGKTTLQFTLLGDQTDNNDTRFVTRFPGEVIPWAIASLSTTVPAGQVATPQNIAKGAAPATSWNNQVVLAENDAMKTKTSGFNATSETPLTDKIKLKIGANYELVHTEIGGGRPLVTATDTPTGLVQVVTNNYLGLAGGTRVKDFVGNIALDLQPTKTLFVKVAFRAQDEFIRGASTYNVVAASGTPAVTLATTPRLGWAKLHQNAQTPVLELRYTGIKDLALYANGSARSLNGDERNTSHYNPLTAANGTLANNDVSEKHGDYTLGANWKQSQFLTLRAEVFQKGHKDNSVGYGVNLGDYYLLDSRSTGYKLTALAKPTAELGFTTRFVSQNNHMQVTGFLPTHPAYDSLKGRNYMISENIDWAPSSQVYFQLNGTVTYNLISTIYPRAGVTPAAVNAAGLVTANAFDSNRVLQNSNNNYITTGFLTGFVLDKQTDAQIQANYYRASNGNAALAALTMPYGVSVKDASYTVGLKHKFSDKWIGNAKVGYFDSTNDTSGGNLNFHGPVAYVSLEHAL